MMKLFLLFLNLTFFLLLCGISYGLVGQGASSDFTSEAPPSLRSLVRMFVQLPSGESREDLLGQILNHPGANLKTVEKAIHEIPEYGKAPVGEQLGRSVVMNGKNASYALYVPPSYVPTQSYPLILCLHGAGFTGESYLERWVPRLKDRYLLACPTTTMGTWWTRYGEELVLETIRSVQSEYHVDPDRIFLTGMSNGGIGAWIIGMHHADLFAGIAPMASGIDDVLYPFIENLSHTPVYVLHGAEDRIMPVQLSRDLVKEMQRKEIPYHYQEHTWTHPHAGGHFFPRQELPALIEWFDQQHRTPLPREVSLVRDATHLLPFSWVRIDTTERIAAFSENLVDSRDEYVTRRVYAKIHAELAGPNRFVVSTLRVKRYTLLLNQDLVDFSQPIVVVTNDIRSFTGEVKPNIKTMLQNVRQRSDTQTVFSAKLAIDVPASPTVNQPR